MIQFTGGKGLWPAFRLFGNNGNWPANCGINFMEWVGHNHNACYATLHGVGYSGGNGFGNHGNKKVNNISDTYHKYAIEQNPHGIEWFIDDKFYFCLLYATVSRSR